MTKSDHHKPINFVGLYFIDEEGYETGQIIAEISDGYYLAQFDCVERKCAAAPIGSIILGRFQQSLRQLWSAAWRSFANVESRQKWITWLNSPDPANDKMAKIVHLKPQPDQPA